VDCWQLTNAARDKYVKFQSHKNCFKASDNICVYWREIGHIVQTLLALTDLIFCAFATCVCGKGIMFSGCPSVSACFRASVRACVLLARHVTNQWTGFHQILVDGVFESTDELIMFWRLRGQGQGRYKVRCTKLRDSISPERLVGSQPNLSCNTVLRSYELIRFSRSWGQN